MKEICLLIHLPIHEPYDFVGLILVQFFSVLLVEDYPFKQKVRSLDVVCA